MRLSIDCEQLEEGRPPTLTGHCPHSRPCCPFSGSHANRSPSHFWKDSSSVPTWPPSLLSRRGPQLRCRRGGESPRGGRHRAPQHSLPPCMAATLSSAELGSRTWGSFLPLLRGSCVRRPGDQLVQSHHPTDIESGWGEGRQNWRGTPPVPLGA